MQPAEQTPHGPSLPGGSEALPTKVGGFNPWKAINPIVQRVRRGMVPVPPLPDAADGGSSSSLGRSTSVSRLPQMVPMPPADPNANNVKGPFRRPLGMSRQRSSPAAPGQEEGGPSPAPPTPPMNSARPPMAPRGQRSSMWNRSAGNPSESPQPRSRPPPQPSSNMVTRSAPAAPIERPGSGSTPATPRRGLSSKTREMLEVQMMAMKLFQELQGKDVTEEGATSTIEQYPELGWLAICLQRSPVPPSWSCKRDDDGPVRYMHSVTGKTTEVPPHLGQFVQLAKLMMMWRKRERSPKDVSMDLKREHEKSLTEAMALRRDYTGPHKDEIAGRDFWQNVDDEAVISWVEPGASADFAARAALRLMQALPAPAQEGPASSSSTDANPESQDGEVTPRCTESGLAPVRPPSRGASKRSSSLQPLVREGSEPPPSRNVEGIEGSQTPRLRRSSSSRLAGAQVETMEAAGESSQTPRVRRSSRHHAVDAGEASAEAVDGSQTPRVRRSSRHHTADDAPTEAAPNSEPATSEHQSEQLSRRPPSARGARPSSSRRGRPTSARGHGSEQPAKASTPRHSKLEDTLSRSGAFRGTATLEEGKFGGTAVVKEVCQMVISAAVDEVHSSSKSDPGSPAYIAVEADESMSSGMSRMDTSTQSDATPRSPSLLSVHKDLVVGSQQEAISPIATASPSIIIMEETTATATAKDEDVPPQVLCFDANPKTPPRRRRLTRPVKCGAPQPLSARGHKEQADVEVALLSARQGKYAGNKGNQTARGEPLSARTRHSRPCAVGGA
mmetsp:Transcript_22101/g.50548  ORF Transcript_22101/g.50548 Transcript_22101/m.50548 type:complete len:787 (+) Transcript_22101:61-2421(+)